MLCVDYLRAVEEHPVFTRLAFDEAKSFENLKRWNFKKIIKEFV